MKLLLATDLSERSDRAMKRAVRLRRSLNAELEILHVVDEQLPIPIARDIRANVQEMLREQLSALGVESSADVKVNIVFGHAWEAIVETANETRPELLVLGAHRDRGLVDLFQGTTLHRVARAVDSPVLVVTREPTAGYHDVLVATDFSASATTAATMAGRLASASEVTLVHAYHIPFKGFAVQSDARGDISARDRKQIEDPIKKEFEAWANTLPVELRRARRVLREGGPVQVLDELALTKRVDLLALGQHSRSGFVEAFLGSTARELMSNPPTDLLLTPAQPYDR